MICLKCGHRENEGKFCNKCGAMLLLIPVFETLENSGVDIYQTEDGYNVDISSREPGIITEIRQAMSQISQRGKDESIEKVVAEIRGHLIEGLGSIMAEDVSLELHDNLPEENLKQVKELYEYLQNAFLPLLSICDFILNNDDNLIINNTDKFEELFSESIASFEDVQLIITEYHKTKFF